MQSARDLVLEGHPRGPVYSPFFAHSCLAARETGRLGGCWGGERGSFLSAATALLLDAFTSAYGREGLGDNGQKKWLWGWGEQKPPADSSQLYGYRGPFSPATLFFTVKAVRCWEEGPFTTASSSS